MNGVFELSKMYEEILKMQPSVDVKNLGPNGYANAPIYMESSNEQLNVENESTKGVLNG